MSLLVWLWGTSRLRSLCLSLCCLFNSLALSESVYVFRNRGCSFQLLLRYETVQRQWAKAAVEGVGWKSFQVSKAMNRRRRRRRRSRLTLAPVAELLDWGQSSAFAFAWESEKEEYEKNPLSYSLPPPPSFSSLPLSTFAGENVVNEKAAGRRTYERASV